MSASNMSSSAYADGLVYTPGGKLEAVVPGAAGKSPTVAWSSNKLATGYATPLLWRGKIYGLGYKGILRCADAKTGAALWNLRLDGDFATSPVLADGKLYATNEEGATFVIDAAKKQILSTNHLSDKILASPAIANGALYLRSDGWLYCIGGKRKADVDR
jgi:outer membrane protein assembly factor BamB